VANSDQLLQRNKDFAATCAHEEASIIAGHPVYVITCRDPRTDPSAFLELKPRGAMVVRNARGRVSSSPPRPCTDARPVSPLSQQQHLPFDTTEYDRTAPPPGPSRAEVLRSLA
jgi:hypothetical protein